MARASETIFKRGSDASNLDGAVQSLGNMAVSWASRPSSRAPDDRSEREPMSGVVYSRLISVRFWRRAGLEQRVLAGQAGRL